KYFSRVPRGHCLRCGPKPFGIEPKPKVRTRWQRDLRDTIHAVGALVNARVDRVGDLRLGTHAPKAARPHEENRRGHTRHARALMARGPHASLPTWWGVPNMPNEASHVLVRGSRLEIS